MATALEQVRDLTGHDYQYGFVTMVEEDRVPVGLSEDVVRQISAKKEEPEWMTEWRLESYRRWVTMTEPTWQKPHYPAIDYQGISYYAAPKQKEQPKSLDEIDPEFLTSDEHEHDEAVQSFVFRSAKAFDPVKLEDFLGGLIQVYGPDMLRYKGVLYMKGADRQTVFQGVHMMMGADQGRRWQPGEKPTSKMVFIGRNLPKETFIKGLEQCLA